MTTPALSAGTRPMTPGQQLAAQAAAAAEVRGYQTDPDVVALRVEKARTVTEWFIWTGMVLGLAFTMSNVQQFAAHTIGAGAGSLSWWACWLLDPCVSAVLLGILLAERHTSRHRVTVSDWTRMAKWGLLAATYTMNCWQSYAAGSAAGIVLHSMPPLVVFLGAEAVTDLQDKLTECVHRAHAHAAARADRRATAQATGTGDDVAGTPTGPPLVAVSAPGDSQTATAVAGAAPIRPLGPLVPASAPLAGAVRPGATAEIGPPDRSGVAPGVGAPDRSDLPARTGPADRPADRPGGRSAPATQTHPADRPADRSAPTRADRSGPATRTGSGRKQTSKPRTDAQLSTAVRQLAEQNGRPPSQYQLKQQFGVGSDRAARLLAELATPIPGRQPGPNGTPTRTEGTR